MGGQADGAHRAGDRAARKDGRGTPHIGKPRVSARADDMLDPMNDELPYRMSTDAGGIINLKLRPDLPDRQVTRIQQWSADSHAEQLPCARAWLERQAEGSGSGRMLPMHLASCIVGLPYRIGAIEDLPGWPGARPDSWFAPACEVVAARQSGPATSAHR